MRSTLALLLVAICAGCGPDGVCATPQRGEVCRIAGTGVLGYNHDGFAPHETELNLPSAIRRGPDGRVYVMDFNNQRLRVIDGGVFESVVGDGFHALADPTRPAIESSLENPIDFAFGPDGSLVFVSYHDPRVLRVTDDHLEVLAGLPEVGLRGDEGDHESPLLAQFIQLDGIAIDDAGTIYVSDSLANRVRRIADGVITTVAGTGGDGFSGDGGPAIDAELYWPTALELAPDGSLLIADTRNHAVRRLATDGTITTIAGGGTQGFAGDGGPATDAQLAQPNGLAVAPDGTIYIADRANFRVRRVRTDGVIDTIAGEGSQGLHGDGGPALDAAFGYLARISLDGDTLLVADQSSSCVRRVALP